MAVKHLRGAYPDGYALNSKYTGLVIEDTATVGGTGVFAGFDTTIRNHGVVDAAGESYGVRLTAGGTVTNGSSDDTAALIEGYRGVGVIGGSATVANYGTLRGLGDYGVLLSAGGAVINGSTSDTTALIAGAKGILAGDASVTVANFGTIQGTAGYGVRLSANGNVTNGSAADTTALLEGSAGIVGNQPATITNFGTIRGSAGYGVLLERVRGIRKAQSIVVNGSAADTSALIEGGVGMRGPAAVTNFGTIHTIAGSRDDAGVFLSAGGTVTNGSATDTGALIYGVVVAVGRSATIANFGTIQGVKGSNSDGVVLINADGAVINGSATDTEALIAGDFGILVSSAARGATITNFGTISATVGPAVYFNSASDVLVVEAGSAFLGRVLGAKGTLDLASGAGTISNLTGGDVTVSGSMPTTNFTNFGTIGIAKGAQFRLGGSGTIASDGTAVLIDDGLLKVTGALLVKGGTIRGFGTLTVGGALTDAGATAVSVIAVRTIDAGSIMAAGATLDLTKKVTGSGAMSVDSGATLEVDAAAASTLSMTFNGGNATLALEHPKKFAATIEGFGPTDTIDLIDIAATSAVLGADDTLIITNGFAAVATLKLAGDYTGDTFTTKSDGNGGTDITVNASGLLAPPPAPPLHPRHAFIAASASFGAPGGAAHLAVAAHEGAWQPILATPRMQIA